MLVVVLAVVVVVVLVLVLVVVVVDEELIRVFVGVYSLVDADLWWAELK